MSPAVRVEDLTLEQKVGQLVVAYVTGASADEADPHNVERFGVATPAAAVRDLHLGGVIYFAWSRNTQSPGQIGELSAGLQAAAEVPVMIGIDAEVGGVNRIGPAMTRLPDQWALGASGEPERTAAAYATTARELTAMGITVDFAPVADVNLDPANPVIGRRAFGADPDLVAAHVAAAVTALQAEGVSAVAKHFPGHGDTAADSHVSLPVVTHDLATWAAVDAPPFRAATRAGADAIMTAHVAFPGLDRSGAPATLSRLIMGGLLRQEIGFAGVVVTDSLRMEGVRVAADEEVAVRAVEAGADVILDPPWPARVVGALLAAVRSGRLEEHRVDDSVRRILAMKRRASRV